MKDNRTRRDTIFIGHANPEDDEFTLWLLARLKNEGYDVECDHTVLIGGEDDYWKILQDLLDNRARKYLLVLSEHTFKKQGIIDEWEQAKAIAKRTAVSRVLCLSHDIDLLVGDTKAISEEQCPEFCV